MEAKIIRIGNSRGVRLPKAMLEQAGLTDTVEISVEGSRILIEPSQKHPRDGWKEMFSSEPTNLESEDSEWLEASLTDEDDRW